MTSMAARAGGGPDEAKSMDSVAEPGLYMVELRWEPLAAELRVDHTSVVTDLRAMGSVVSPKTRLREEDSNS